MLVTAGSFLDAKEKDLTLKKNKQECEKWYTVTEDDLDEMEAASDRGDKEALKAIHKRITNR